MAKNIWIVQGIAVKTILDMQIKSLYKAINKQSKKLWHVSNAFKIPEGEKLAKKLTKKTFNRCCYFSK